MTKTESCCSTESATQNKSSSQGCCSTESATQNKSSSQGCCSTESTTQKKASSQGCCSTENTTKSKTSSSKMMNGVFSIVEISKEAAQEVFKIRQEQGVPEDHRLRIGIAGGGCSGFSYRLEFDNEAMEGDMVMCSNGVDYVVDGRSAMFLSGVMLHYTSGLNGRGFVFNNPNAQKTCGCGSSFSV